MYNLNFFPLNGFFKNEGHFLQFQLLITIIKMEKNIGDNADDVSTSSVSSSDSINYPSKLPQVELNR